MLHRPGLTSLLAVISIVGFSEGVHAQKSYIPLRTQVYGGTYSTPAYTENAATATRQTRPYDLFSHCFRENYPHAVHRRGLNELSHDRLTKFRATEIGKYAEERFVAH